MHEPDIAPLARRLAEENNVDWRRLAGSGEGGRVVERDVLGYLARVMAGDEAVDPTPEPVPEGMEAWPEGDVVAHRKGADPDEEPDTRSTLDDDLFLFDDPAAAGGSHEADSDRGDAALFVPSDDDEQSGQELRDLAQDGHVIEGLVAGEDQDEDGVWLVGDDAAAVDAAAGGGGAPAEPIWADPDDGDVPDELRLDELPDLTEGEAGNGAPQREDEVGRGAGGRDAFVLPDLFADEGVSTEGASIEGASVGGSSPAGVSTDRASTEAPSPEGKPTASIAFMQSDAEREVSDGAGPETAPSDSGAVAAPEAEEATAEFRWVRHGQLWRRRLDDRALRQAASDAAAALDVPPTTVVALLLARAASRAGVATGPVEVWRWRRSGADRIGVDLDASVRDAAHGIETGAAVAGAQGVSLVVADHGDLAVDEAVLHLEVPVLALGRSGADGSWLSLSGDELDGGAAAGLARVADLLGSPVRLLV